MNKVIKKKWRSREKGGTNHGLLLVVIVLSFLGVIEVLAANVYGVLICF